MQKQVLNETELSGPPCHNAKEIMPKNTKTLKRETERQHMHWQRFKLQLEEEDACLYATICWFAKTKQGDRMERLFPFSRSISSVAASCICLTNQSSHDF